MAAPKTKKDQKFQPSGETHRIVSLGGGTWAYLFDANGKTHHLPVDSTEFVELCRETNEALGGRIENELMVLGWDNIADKIR